MQGIYYLEQICEYFISYFGNLEYKSVRQLLVLLLYRMKYDFIFDHER